MADYKVKIYPTAQNDLLDIIEAVGAQSSDADVLSISAITEKLAALTTSPESHPLARDTLLRKRGYRTLQVDNYIAFFVIKGKSVELRRILCARRQYARLL